MRVKHTLVSAFTTRKVVCNIRVYGILQHITTALRYGFHVQGDGRYGEASVF